jgi:hypothetical protein
MSVLESATEAANRIIHGDEHSEDEVQLVSGELLGKWEAMQTLRAALSKDTDG